VKVKNLIACLQDYDPEATVRLMVQPNYPFEDSIQGVVERREFEEEVPDGCKADDVFILDGGQVRYGSQKAWEVS
jgi:hypothetical protein